MPDFDYVNVVPLSLLVAGLATLTFPTKAMMWQFFKHTDDGRGMALVANGLWGLFGTLVGAYWTITGKHVTCDTVIILVAGLLTLFISTPATVNRSRGSRVNIAIVGATLLGWGLFGTFMGLMGILSR